jgi:hypothetical protein
MGERCMSSNRGLVDDPGYIMQNLKAGIEGLVMLF